MGVYTLGETFSGPGSKMIDLAIIATAFIECPVCLYAQRLNQSPGGHLCSNCKEISSSNKLYFDLRVPMFIDHVVEAYNSIDPERESQENVIPPHSFASVVLFYCTLREVLISHLVNRLAAKDKIPNLVLAKLLKSYSSQRQKTEQLIPSFTKVKWAKMIEGATKADGLEYAKHERISVELIRKRNAFIHDGALFEMDRESTDQAISEIKNLVRIFVCFNNAYVSDMKKEK